MKTLTTEQQTELQELLRKIIDNNELVDQHDIEYWIQELKPKRVRRKVTTTQETNTDDN